ncbi:FAD/NAD(P)-binding domain-containing protein [Penicillium lagena]|uniref:FAD/NAD(P)-binding domain-containing protein n=1 Tax=Penicillium lagena TaxID=94218 RepID=UPI00253FE6EF|nr:FAD/NAD(P)-binding domain-containing protein [Penicillium lagena]KAJ5620311.1 FAD/NAD(P)-binding domain-containing protein [Penicillium lagena]
MSPATAQISTLFKVIIVGGGIAGLTLALMLERNRIEYLLIEAYPEISSPVGGGVGLTPNGLRILDQLGCYETLLKLSENPVDKAYYHGPDEQVLRSIEDLHRLSCERHGYPVIFVDRAMLVHVLFDHLRDKSKVLTRKRVTTVIKADHEAQVITQDGSTYSADIVVGTDGVHSVIRQEIKRHAHEAGVGHIYLEDDKIPATYACIFGMSTAVPGIASDSVHYTFREKSSYVIGAGPKDRTYWFLNVHMDQTFYGTGIPKFTRKDEAKVVQQHWNDHIAPGVRFADLYHRKLTSLYTPLREYVHSKWYFGRMLTIGDASHQILPIAGQGANSAIESAASLMNCLFKALSSPLTPGRPSSMELGLVFEAVQQQRIPRVQWLLENANQRQQLEAMETPEHKEAATNQIPNLTFDHIFSKWQSTYASAVSLQMVDMPSKPRTCLFQDEMHSAKSTGQNRANL